MASEPETARATEERELWARYRDHEDLAARDALVSRYWWLVVREARRFRARRGDFEALDQLVSAGGLGLLQAIDRFDPNRGLSFSTFATPRILGAMRDDCRSVDWMPRLARRRSRLLAAARNRVERRAGRSVGMREVAQELSLDLPTLWRWQEQAARGTVELERLMGHGGEPEELPAGAELDGHLLAMERSHRIRQAVYGLPPRERDVLALAYFEERSGNEIAVALGVSAARVSQLRSQGIARLRRVTELREYA